MFQQPDNKLCQEKPCHLANVNYDTANIPYALHFINHIQLLMRKSDILGLEQTKISTWVRVDNKLNTLPGHRH